MARIYFVLALFATGLLVTNLVLGWTTGDFGGELQKLLVESREVQELKRSLRTTPQQQEAAQAKFDEAREAFRPFERHKVVHVWMGIAAALVTLLVNAIGMTYFIGTNRWCREVVEAYALDLDVVQRSSRLKRRSFAWALLSMLAILGVVSLGALSDPMANPAGSSDWVGLHFVAALVATALIAWSFLTQVVNIGAHYEIIEQVMRDVRQLQQSLREGSPVVEPAESH